MSNRIFMDRKEIFEILQEQSEDVGVDLIAFLGIGELTPFFVESTFLQHWNLKLEDAPKWEGLDELTADLVPVDSEEPGGAKFVQFFIRFVPSDDHSDPDEIYLNITPDHEHSGRYALQIVHNDNVVYERTAEQDERTEWLINQMANDLTDENGNYIFPGDPVNI